MKNTGLVEFVQKIRPKPFIPCKALTKRGETCSLRRVFGDYCVRHYNELPREQKDKLQDQIKKNMGIKEI